MHHESQAVSLTQSAQTRLFALVCTYSDGWNCMVVHTCWLGYCCPFPISSDTFVRAVIKTVNPLMYMRFTSAFFFLFVVSFVFGVAILILQTISKHPTIMSNKRVFFSTTERNGKNTHKLNNCLNYCLFNMWSMQTISLVCLLCAPDRFFINFFNAIAVFVISFFFFQTKSNANENCRRKKKRAHVISMWAPNQRTAASEKKKKNES